MARVFPILSSVVLGACLAVGQDATPETGTTVPQVIITPEPTATTPQVAITPEPTATFVIPAPSTPAPVTIPNWVGPKVNGPKDNACYRKTHRTHNCPQGFTFDNIATCWAQCPIDYPVRCGMECIPQNDDCALAVLRKITDVGKAILGTASSGLFGGILNAHKELTTGLHCGQELFMAVDKATGFIDDLRAANPQGTAEEIKWALTKSDFVVSEIPRAVAICLGVSAPDTKHAEAVAVVVRQVVDKLLDKVNPRAVVDANSPQTFLNFANEAGINSVDGFSDKEVEDFTKFVQAGSTCGKKVKEVIDKVIANVKEIKASKPHATADAIRVIIATSDLVMNQLPVASLGCMEANAPDGYRTRDQVLKTARMIIDKIVNKADHKDGQPRDAGDYALAVADLGLDVLARFDSTGIVKMAQDFIQPICGPTAFLGEIDDGPADKALGLKTMQKAFRGSSGEWTKKGDGKIRITFDSVDIYDVTVNIKSGGYELDQVKVPAGAKGIVWERSLSEMQDKTLYMDRWRPGFLWIPGTGGGSLAMWMPHPPAEGGHLELHVTINPTTWRDSN